MVCTNCQKELLEGSRFCDRCGQPISPPPASVPGSGRVRAWQVGLLIVAILTGAYVWMRARTPVASPSQAVPIARPNQQAGDASPASSLGRLLGQGYSVSRYKEAQKRVRALEAKYSATRVEVMGSITDKSRAAISVFGRTSGCEADNEGCLSFDREWNIVIREPDWESVRQWGGVHYQGTVYFRGRSSGTNAFGASVPVFIYSGAAPPALAEAEADVARLRTAAAADGLDPETGESLAAIRARESGEAKRRMDEEGAKTRAEAAAQFERRVATAKENTRSEATEAARRDAVPAERTSDERRKETPSGSNGLGQPTFIRPSHEKPLSDQNKKALERLKEKQKEQHPN